MIMRKLTSKKLAKRAEIQICQEDLTHPEAINRVKRRIPDDNLFSEMSEFYKAFASESRVKILSALAVSELCVCDIASLLGLTQSAVSHQLALLKSLRLIKSRRDRKQVYYSLDDEHITAILAIAREHLSEP